MSEGRTVCTYTATLGAGGKSALECISSTYLLLDLPYTCRLSEDTAVLVVASSVLLLLGNT